MVRSRNAEKIGTKKSESESSDSDSSREVPRYVIPLKRRSDSWSRSSRDTNWRHRSSDTGPKPVTQTPLSNNPVPLTHVSNTAQSPVHIPILTSPDASRQDTNPISEEPVFIPDSSQHMSAPVSPEPASGTISIESPHCDFLSLDQEGNTDMSTTHSDVVSPMPRRTGRTRKAPDRYGEWVMSPHIEKLQQAHVLHFVDNNF